jgi:hypothetical protein
LSESKHRNGLELTILCLPLAEARHSCTHKSKRKQIFVKTSHPQKSIDQTSNQRRIDPLPPLSEKSQMNLTSVTRNHASNKKAIKSQLLQSRILDP